MNELPYKMEHLQEYKGILTSSDARKGNFKMELKVEDNPVLKRSIEKIESGIELEFHYNFGTSTLFFHNVTSCPKSRRDEECPECKNIIAIYDKFTSDLYYLQFGDTFKIKAALINNDRSELPIRIQSFKDYERIEAACTEYRLRLEDTPEGIKKKYELEQQRLQREREEEERRREEEEKRKIEADKAKGREKWDRLEQWFAKYPNILKIGVTILGATVLNQIDHIFNSLKSLFKLIFPD